MGTCIIDKVLTSVVLVAILMQWMPVHFSRSGGLGGALNRRWLEDQRNIRAVADDRDGPDNASRTDGVP